MFTKMQDIQFDIFIKLLSDCFHKTLPGRTAQQRMSHTDDIESTLHVQTAQKSGILTLFYPIDNRPYFVLIKRTQSLPHHRGQICFPGGKYESFDRNISATALREAKEEVGVTPADVQIVGKLSPVYIQVSGFLVYPTVGFLHYKPLFKKNSMEVAELIEVSLHEILDTNCKQTKKLCIDNKVYMVPFYNIKGHMVWGATAKILSELEILLKQ